jgi:hypothetical protein
LPRLDAYRPRTDEPPAAEAPRPMPGQVPFAAPGSSQDAAAAAATPVAVRQERPAPDAGVPLPAPRPEAEPASRPTPATDAATDPGRPTCTAAQLRRFIKSRPWIPMHELRRRFGIVGGDDDVTPVRVNGTTLFIGLPLAEGRLMGELLASGDVGYELSLDPGAPIVVGVYPMRPVARG